MPQWLFQWLARSVETHGLGVGGVALQPVSGGRTVRRVDWVGTSVSRSGGGGIVARWGWHKGTAETMPRRRCTRKALSWGGQSRRTQAMGGGGKGGQV